MDDQRGSDVPVVIRPLAPDELPHAASVLAEGMRDNPLHLQAFGAGTQRRQRCLRRLMGYVVDYVEGNGVLLGACAQGELVGVLGMLEPGRCRPKPRRILKFALAIALGNTPTAAWRIRRWFAAWARNDPREPHWHLGPLAVLPAWRRQGVGRRLMQHSCQYLDVLASTAWLETDGMQNVLFYRSFGFVVTREAAVLGVRNWFMCRPSR